VTLTVTHITPLISLIAGILILIVPRLLNFIAALHFRSIQMVTTSRRSSAATETIGPEPAGFGFARSRTCG
jgi:hypothetical protein